MARCIFIVQGEGRGHLSQAMALEEHLIAAGHTVEAVYTGSGGAQPIPDYYKKNFSNRLHLFASPYFLRTPNKKGIYVLRTLLFNLLRTILYLREVKRIRKEIILLDPEVVFNFYDVVGGLAMRKLSDSIRRIGIGHHFFLHLDEYQCDGGNRIHKWFLRFHTKLIMKSCDRILALSFRDTAGNQQIKVVPPLVRKKFRETNHKKGSRALIYLLNEGFITDLISIAKSNPEFQADIFSQLPADTPVPGGLRLHAISDKDFLEKMESCSFLVTTAGFDSVAEAAYMGVPLAVVPVRNHFEQRCNSMDVVNSGLGVSSEGITPDTILKIKESHNVSFRKWVDQAGGIIINQMSE